MMILSLSLCSFVYYDFLSDLYLILIAKDTFKISQLNNSSSIDTKLDHITKAGNCFIKRKGQSFDGDMYSNTKHGSYLLNLLKLINDKNLSVWVFENSHRLPNINTIKCNLPFNSYVVSPTNYYMVNGENSNDFNYKYSRKICKQNHLICHALDFQFFLQWLLSQNQNVNDTQINEKWILTLEDDVLLCPKLLEGLLNIILNKNGIMNNSTSLWFLGHGNTALLFRNSYISKYSMLIQEYLDEQKENPMDYGIDLWILQKAHIMKLTDIVASIHTLVYHPSSLITQSTQSHFYKEDFPCHQMRKWPHKRIRYFLTFNNNTINTINITNRSTST